MYLQLLKKHPYFSTRDDILNLNLKTHLFNEVLNSFLDPEHTLSKTNDVTKLASDNFIGHPSIHRGYYDYKRSGVLYVRDYFNPNKYIRKDSSVLMVNGHFASQRYVIHEGNVSNNSRVKEELKKYYRDPKNYEKNRVPIVVYDSLFYYPFNPKDYIFCLRHPSSLQNLLDRTFDCGYSTSFEVFCRTLSSLYVAGSVLDSLFEVVHEPNFAEDKPECYKRLNIIPPLGLQTPPFYYLKQELGVRFVLDATPPSEREVPYVDTTHSLFQEYTPASGGYVFVGVFNVLGVEVGFVKRVARRQEGRNLTTKNSEGIRLPWSSRVTQYKQCFLMTPQQEKFYADTKKKPLFMGIELEVIPKVSYRNQDGEIIKQIAQSSFGNHCIITSDSSIHDNGFEIVTVPATLEYHTEMFKNHFFIKNDPNHFSKKLTASPRCGIHIHLSRDFFTRLSMGKFISFINLPSNQTFIVAMANREENSYCRRIALPSRTSKGIVSAVKIVSPKFFKMDGENEYLTRGACNFTSNTKTVEVRIFKGSAQDNNVLRKLEFCHALAHFCKYGGYSYQQIYYTDFIEYLLSLQDKTRKYPHLMRWLGAKEFINQEQKMVDIKGVRQKVIIYSKKTS